MLKRNSGSLGDNLGEEEIKGAPHVFTLSLLRRCITFWRKMNSEGRKLHMFCTPNKNELMHAFRVGNLFWYDGMIPDSEIW